MEPLLHRPIDVGDRLPTLSWQFSEAQFTRGGSATIHSDPSAARAEGLKEPVATGPQVAALIFRQLRGAFGRGWLEGGECSLTFRRPVSLNAFATARGTVTGCEEIPGGLRVECEVWIESPGGEKLITGSAAGTLFDD